MSNKTTIDIDGNNRSAIAAINGVKQEFNDFTNKISSQSNIIGGSLKSLMGLFAGAFSVSTLANFTRESIDLASKWQGVNNAFQRLPDNQKLIENLRAAVKGTTDDLTLMQYAVRAENFKIPMDALVKGLEFAKIRASETGQSIDYMLDSFVTGLGRQSVKILDNLGISALEIQQEFEKTGDFAKAVGDIMDRELSKTDRSFTTAKDSAERLTASFINFKTEVGKDLIDDLDDLSLKIAGLTEGFTDLNTQVKLFSGQGIIGNLVDAIANFQTMGVNLEKIVGIDGAIQQFINKQKEIKKHTAEVNKEFYATFGAVTTIYPFLVDQTNKENDSLNTKLNTLKAIKDEYAKLVETVAAGSGQSTAAQASYIEMLVNPGEMMQVDVNPFDALSYYTVDFFDMYDERAQLMREQTSAMFGNMGSAASMFYQMSGQKARAWFEIQKGFNIAQAVMNTYEGATKALAQGGFFGIAMAATVIAAGLAQVAMIASQQPGRSSGGAVRSAGSTGSVNPIRTGETSGGGNQYLNITINGNYWDDDMIARNLIPSLKKAYGDSLGNN